MTAPYMREKIQQHYATTNVRLQVQQQCSNAVAASSHTLKKVYEYIHGSGHEKNRQIRFFRPGDATTIQAQVFVLGPTGVENIITTLVASQISVKKKQESSSLFKVFLSNPTFSERPLSDLDISEQDVLLHKNIAVDPITENDPTKWIGIERVVHLRIMDPT